MQFHLGLFVNPLNIWVMGIVEVYTVAILTLDSFTHND